MTEHEVNERKNQIIQMTVGALLFVIALFLRGYTVRPYIYFASYAILGWKVVFHAVKNMIRRQFFDENFLMTIASAGAFVIGRFAEAAAVMLFYAVGEFFQELAVDRSRKSIADLMDIRPDYANLKVNGELVRVSPETLKPGDIIVVKPGEKIPTDGIVTEGEAALDMAALTGESAPKNVRPSDGVLSGCINVNGALTIEVTKEFDESTASKILELVQNASAKKAHAENFITKFSKYYTPAVVTAALLLAVISPAFFGGAWADWIHRAFIFLVISCPCALVISVPLGFFGGIGAASRRGILIKGGNFLEALNYLDIVAFDKTGTLTKGNFTVTEIYPANRFTAEDLLFYAAGAEAFSTHPVATPIILAAPTSAEAGKIETENIKDYREIPGRGVSAVINGKRVLAGNEALMANENIPFIKSGVPGTAVYVSADGAYAGCIVISDETKPGSYEAVAKLKEQGVRKAVMLTGDNFNTAASVADTLPLDEFFYGLLPHQKVEIVEMLEKQKRPGGKLAFVGDGINDAPVLARADVGVAMGGLGSQAAIEAADVVLMTDDLSKISDAVSIAKKTKRIVWQNIIFILAVKGIFLILGAFGVSEMWEAVFADTGVAVLAVLNSLRIIRR